jgi:hypothetical protein
MEIIFGHMLATVEERYSATRLLHLLAIQNWEKGIMTKLKLFSRLFFEFYKNNKDVLLMNLLLLNILEILLPPKSTFDIHRNTNQTEGKIHITILLGILYEIQYEYSTNLYDSF